MRVMENFSHRIDGSMRFRFILQPLMAVLFATIDGLKDAKAGYLPYLWSLFTQPQHRAAKLQHGWKSVGKVFVLAIVLDVIFQITELHNFFPLEALVIALLLAIVPYVCLRGIVCRLARRR
jgi:threonine/homoserine efflux transporter RhtA